MSRRPGEGFGLDAEDAPPSTRCGLLPAAGFAALKAVPCTRTRPAPHLKRRSGIRDTGPPAPSRGSGSGAAKQADPPALRPGSGSGSGAAAGPAGSRAAPPPRTALDDDPRLGPSSFTGAGSQQQQQRDTKPQRDTDAPPTLARGVAPAATGSTSAAGPAAPSSSSTAAAQQPKGPPSLAPPAAAAPPRAAGAPGAAPAGGPPTLAAVGAGTGAPPAASAGRPGSNPGDPASLLQHTTCHRGLQGAREFATCS